jgi:hypothetical protein
VCLELEDHGVARRSAVAFFGLKELRDPHSAAGRLAEQFVDRNRELLGALDVRVDREYDGRDVSLLIRAGSSVGAVPLFSPTSARPDYGLVVQPRFAWMGIGPMLAEMGWRVGPSPLRLPLLRRSERRVPSWVLSSMILVRMSALLDSLDRRFEVVQEDRTAPRGRVDWKTYATTRLSRANVLSIPCSFPDLRDDRQLKGAIRFTVEKQLRSLETQKEHGAFVHQLLEFGRQVFRRVQFVPGYLPSRGTMDAWMQRPLRAQHFADGIQGIRWTVEDRGLAGLSDLEGIPWRMPMEEFFEAWVETVLTAVIQKTGGRMKVGRKRETVHAVNWQPPYVGSQRALVPDFWIEYNDVTVIVDAKYKRHWEELQQHSWARVEEELREQHRHDLLQVLAYGNLATTQNVVVCLAYPCSEASWTSLLQRGRLHHQAEIAVGPRTVRLWLTAVPMAVAVEQVAEPLAREFGALLSR